MSGRTDAILRGFYPGETPFFFLPQGAVPVYRPNVYMTLHYNTALRLPLLCPARRWSFSISSACVLESRVRVLRLLCASLHKQLKEFGFYTSLSSPDPFPQNAERSPR